MDKRLFLIDAYAMIFRGYYALIRNPRLTSYGLDTSAIFGFTNSLIELIKREKPSHIAVVFDVGKANVRTNEFAEYKANRSETPEAIKVGVPYIHQILEAMRIPILGVEGYEADDVIGTIANKAENEGYTTFMVTPDKDFGQLVTDNIKIYKPASKGNDIEIIGVKEIKEKYGINEPKQVIDILAMMGDAVDNIPGLQGVGEKTALKFVQEYGSIENLLANTHNLKGKLKEKIEASAELGVLSKKLATIITDVPIEFEEEKYNLEVPDFQKIKNIFEKIEFRRLYDNIYKIWNTSNENQTQQEESIVIENIEKETQKDVSHQLILFSDIEDDTLNNSAVKQTISEREHLYQYINTTKGMQILLANLLKQKSVAFDIKTTSDNEFQAEIVGISFSYRKKLAYFVPFAKNQDTYILEIFRPFFEKEEILKIAYNFKFFLKILYRFGIKVNGKVFDPMVAHYLLNPDSRHNIEYLSEVYLKYIPISEEILLGKGRKKILLSDISLEKQTDFAGEGAEISYQLFDFFVPQLKNENLEELFYSIEMPLMRVLAKMEIEGITLDLDWLKKESTDLEGDLKELEQNIFDLSGEVFNLNSPKQLGEILFGKLQLDPKAKKTKTGQYSTSEEVLQKLASKHRIISHILEYRTYQKLKSTYVDALPNEIQEVTGRVHTTFSQTTAATGRLSSLNPNLQNIPIRTLRGQQIRGAFVAGPGKKIISADYSQIELRLIAEISEEENMIKAFQNGEDIHTSTASKLFKIPNNEVTKQLRSQAKSVNFGIIYGQGAFTLAEQTGLSRTEAKEMIDNYYQNYPKLKEFIANQIQKARQNGFVETILGRRRYLKDINSNNFVVRGHSERNAVNTPIQGSAADIIKVAMINIDKILSESDLQTKMLLQVHDELLFEVPENEVELVSDLIKTEMENAVKTTVPLLVEVGVGDNWLEAH